MKVELRSFRGFVLACAIACTLVVAPGRAVDAADEGPHVIVMLPVGKPAASLASDIATWRSEGLVRNALHLDATQQQEPGFSSIVVLELTDEAALTEWEKATAKRLPDGARVRRVDACVHGERAENSFATALFEVNVYRMKATAEEYKEYCKGYIAPLMEGQADGGLMTWYTMYLERDAAGDENAVLVKAYRDVATYDQKVEQFKLDLRARLTKEHPTYPRYHAIKDTLRDDVSETLAILPAGR